MPALRAAAAGPRALGGDGQKIRALARDLFDAAARQRTELVHTPFYGARCVILQTSTLTRSIHAKGGRAGGLDGVLADFRPNACCPAPSHRVREPYIQGPLKPSRDRPACTPMTRARSPQ